MPRPGIPYPLTPAWKKAVLKRMGEKGWNRSRLAKELKCSRTAVSDMLSDGQHSALVPEVEALLGMEPSTLKKPEANPEDPNAKFLTESDLELLAHARELETPLTPPSERLDAPMTQQEYVHSQAVILFLLDSFKMLTTTNRIRAVERIAALVNEQKWHEDHELDETPEQAAETQRLDAIIAKYLPGMPLNELGLRTLQILRGIVSFKSTADYKSGEIEPKPLPKGISTQEEIALRAVARMHMEALRNRETLNDVKEILKPSKKPDKS
jgi:hypothetical protein